MGQPIVVVEKPSLNRGIVRFETNRALTGMGHEVYPSGEEVRGNRPPDELARRLLARENVHGVHINGSVVTVDLAKGHTSEGLKQVIEDLYVFYPETAEADGDAAGSDGAAPESDAEVAAEVVADVDAAPDPAHEPAVPAAEAAEQVEQVEVEAAETTSEDVAAEDSAPSADAVVEADEVSEAEVQADEGEAPTVDQEPVSDDAAKG